MLGTDLESECRFEIPSWKIEEQANQNNRIEGIIPLIALRRLYKCGWGVRYVRFNGEIC